jgi:putative transposase
VNIIAQLKLLPTTDQADALTRTLEAANAAANSASMTAWQTQTFRAYDLQKLVYGELRARFGLSAQLMIRVLAKVGDSYKLDRKTQRTFSRYGSIAYDDRILSWGIEHRRVSIWTLDGRQTISFVTGERQIALLSTRKGETDLVYRAGNFYLLAVCVVDEPTPREVDGVLGVDLGVTNIAVDSDGEIHSGAHIRNVRYRHRRLRRKLQRKHTRSASRRLRQLRGQERRFATDTNHVVSKRLVRQAECTKRALVLEDLTHIRSRIKARRPQRVVLHSWAFGQLRAFIAYKAKRAGVPVVLVDPRNTSRECPRCGRIDKASRRSQSAFCCTRCGYAAHADVNAAVIIGRRAGVMQPYAPTQTG